MPFQREFQSEYREQLAEVYKVYRLASWHDMCSFFMEWANDTRINRKAMGNARPFVRENLII